MIGKHFVLIQSSDEYYFQSGEIFKHEMNKYFYWMNKYDTDWYPTVGGFPEEEKIIIVANEEQAKKVIERFKEKLK